MKPPSPSLAGAGGGRSVAKWLLYAPFTGHENPLNGAGRLLRHSITSSATTPTHGRAPCRDGLAPGDPPWRHGILSTGAFISMATEACGFEELFPGIDLHLLGLAPVTRTPFGRDEALTSGDVLVSPFRSTGPI